MNKTPEEIKEAIGKAMEEGIDPANAELVVTVDYIDEIEPGSLFKGFQVALGKNVHVREKKHVQPATVAPVTFSGKAVYWFNVKGVIQPFNAKVANRYLTQTPSKYNYTPQYLGATSAKELASKLDAIEEDPEKKMLIQDSFKDSEQFSGAGKLEAIFNESRKAVQEVYNEVAKEANPAIRPKDTRTEILAADSDIRGDAQQIVRSMLGTS